MQPLATNAALLIIDMQQGMNERSWGDATTRMLKCRCSAC